MECVNDHALDILFMALVLCLFGLAGLIYTAINARRSVIGQRLLEACADDWETAMLAVENVRQENELMADAIGRDFNKAGKR